MAYSVINIYNEKLNSRRDFLCDDVSDLSDLPTSQTSSEEFPEGTGIGSMALITGDSSVYILDNLDTWSELCDLNSGGGDTPTLVDKEILANGTYDPADDDADGYSSVIVNVPSDILVSKTIVQNGTYNPAADNADGYDSVIVNVPSDILVSKNIISNGIYNPLADNADGYSLVNVNVPEGQLYTNDSVYESEEQVTDLTGFTKLYNTSVPYGSNGSKVNTALELTDESVITSNMQGGWSTSTASFYDSENYIGAYAGYSFGTAIPIQYIKLWIGRYSAQNNNLIVTVEYLDENGVWNDVEDIIVATNLPYPVNTFTITIDRMAYGIRWEHKKSPLKTSGNNVVFFGMTLYRGVGESIDVYRPSTVGIINPPSGYVGFDTLYVDNGVSLISKSITSNGIYNPIDDGVAGYNFVEVTVPSDVLVSKNITTNGTYNPAADNADGYSSVNVNVPSDVLVSKTITENGTYDPAADNADGYNSVTVNIEGDVLVSKTITRSGVYDPAEDNADGYSSVTVDVFDGMTILKYGISTWADFIAAYNDNAIVYCRASSNANPATGSQTRLAFMAYVNNETTPTEVEFQYYRSVSSHSASQQGDQVFVYKLTKNAGWTVTTRNAFTQIEVGTGLTSSYNNGVLTISLA